MLRYVYTLTTFVGLMFCQQSPGDSIGSTAFDLHIAGSMGQRIMVDGHTQIHVDWTKMDVNQSGRFLAWNGRYYDGTWYGEVPASLSWSGFAQLDITRDSNPDNQRTVIAYHYNDGSGAQSWIDIDGGNLWGAFPHNPKKTGYVNYVVPYIGIANNNNIIMACAHSNITYNRFRLFLTTDFGFTWSQIAEFDSCCTFSQFVRCSRIPGSHKVVFVWTKYITDSLMATNHDNNVWYMLSMDDGVTWSSPVNVTEYQPYPQDSTRAYCEVNAVFDDNDYLHITWTGQKIDSSDIYVASKIFHWSEIDDTITVVSSPSIYYSDPGGWWARQAGTGLYGLGLPADQPQLVADTSNGWLYCLWHGNDDPADYSYCGYYSGELYGACSSDHGLTWSNYRNITNSRSPGAMPGYCFSEESMTACPFVIGDSIYITFVEDKDAGVIWDRGQREITENPVRCYVFHKDLISGIKEDSDNLVNSACPYSTIVTGPLMLDRSTQYKIFDITGRHIHTLNPAPGIYFIEVNEELWQKVIKIK